MLWILSLWDAFDLHLRSDGWKLEVESPKLRKGEPHGRQPFLYRQPLWLAWGVLRRSDAAKVQFSRSWRGWLRRLQGACAAGLVCLPARQHWGRQTAGPHAGTHAHIEECEPEESHSSHWFRRIQQHVSADRQQQFNSIRCKWRDSKHNYQLPHGLLEWNTSNPVARVFFERFIHSSQS